MIIYAIKNRDLMVEIEYIIQNDQDAMNLNCCLMMILNCFQIFKQSISIFKFY
jgi:23S rRNA A2030 N6-methylase RlmJ